MAARIRTQNAPPFRIKICGVTRLDDVEKVVAAGADAIGLNFYPSSTRFVTLDLAKRLREGAAGDRLRVVGVWVNEAAEQIAMLADELALDAIQLHGSEPVEALRLLADRIVVRAVRHPFSAETLAMLDEAARGRCSPSAVLIDAAVPGQYGGTGATADWGAINRDRALVGDSPTILAGGLRPENVKTALTISGADGVDVASGVESSPGAKDAVLIERFVRAARQALDSQLHSE